LCGDVHGHKGERTRPSAPSTGSGQASGCEVGYGPRDAERLGAILLQTLRVSRRRAFRTGRPSAGIGRRQPSASQVSGTAPRPSRLSCPLPAVRSTPYPPRADAKDYAPAQMTGHKFFEMGLRVAAALGVAKMNACRLGPNPSPSTGQEGNPAASPWRPLSRLLSKSMLS